MAHEQLVSTMINLGWKDAIIRVLGEATRPMHYSEIADRIAEAGLRADLGATPANSVASTLSLSLQNEGERSPFSRVARGYYLLRSAEGTEKAAQAAPESEELLEEAGFINAFGMYWRRNVVAWNRAPKLLGQQQPGSNPVDMSQQRGVYLLHDGRHVVYVGRVTDQDMGVRLFQHTVDRLNGRWDRFSWFGIQQVRSDGRLEAPSVSKLSIDVLIATMEALLIEGLEPPQNRKRGDEFRAVEYLQIEDPDLGKIRLMEELKARL